MSATNDVVGIGIDSFWHYAGDQDNTPVIYRKVLGVWVEYSKSRKEFVTFLTVRPCLADGTYVGLSEGIDVESFYDRVVK